MIPKVIHYCWFGKGEKSKLINKCIRSWKKYCPDYEIIEWNEDNFDIDSTIWTKEAYGVKKWAFVADYVRLFALYNYGGIYLDTDVELIKPIDNLLNDKGFSGWEKDPILVQTGIFGSEKNFDIFKSLLSYYDDRHFIKPDGTYDTATNTHITTDILEGYGFVPDGKQQNIHGFCCYTKDYFCPKDFYSGQIHTTENTVCIHHYNLSWLDEAGRKHWANVRAGVRKKVRMDYIKYTPNRLLLKMLGDSNYAKLKNLIRKIKNR